MHYSDLKWPTGRGQRADCSWDHSSLRRAAGQVLWECKFFCLDLNAIEKMFLGVWAGYNLQLWESLLHAWWAPDRRWSPRDIKEECSQSNRCSGPAPRGWSRPNLWSSFTIPLLLRRRHRKDFLMMQAWANIRFSTRTVGKLGDSVPTTSNQVPSSHDTVWWTGGPLLCLCREQLKHQVSMPQFFRYKLYNFPVFAYSSTNQ